MEASWWRLGNALGHLGGVVGATWRRLGRRGGVLEASWERPGRLGGLFQATGGRLGKNIKSRDGLLAPKIGKKARKANLKGKNGRFAREW